MNLMHPLPNVPDHDADGGDPVPLAFDLIARLPPDIVVLLVDDHPEEIRLLGEMLRRAGAQVLLATHGKEALRLARELCPSVILLDVSLPPTSGIMVCLELRDHPATAGIPVLFLSGMTEPETKVMGFVAGGRDYITKPFIEAEVLARIALHVDLALRMTPKVAGLQLPGEAPPWLPAAVALLQSQSAMTPTLTTLAHQVGTNPRSLNEAFRTHLGQTVFGYLREYRLKEAQRLVLESTLSIQQIASRVGYPQATNFTTAFKARFGVSPRQLRLESEGSAGD